MNRFRVHPLTSIALHEEGEALELSAELEERVAAAWVSECETRGGGLTDAPIFNVTRVNGPTLHGHFVPYSRWVAQLRTPELRESLQVAPGAVCALCFVQDALLFGRRSERTTQDPGAWEPTPAGGIGIAARDETGVLSAKRQILEELREEVNLSRDHVTRIAPFALVIDRVTGVHDVAFELELSISIEAIEGRFRARGTDEVSALTAVSRESLADWMRRAQPSVAPIAHALLEAWESSHRE